MTSLIYEVVWTRYLTSVFGSSNYSISTVLTAFMAGLALGSYGIARSRRLSAISPLVLYIIMEGGIGLFALASPELFEVLKTFSLAILPEKSYLDASTGVAMKFCLSFFLLLLPTLLMGATFPVLSRHMAKHQEGISRPVGGLYALNTFGAVAGTFLAGFVLLHTLGVDNTARVAAMVNLAIAGALWVFHKKGEQGAEARDQESGGKEQGTEKRGIGARDQRQHEGRDGLRKAILALFAVSGFLALGYEVLWTRLLTQVVGSSTFAFSMILLSFLMGIAGGSWALSRLLPEKAITPALFGWLLIGIGVFASLLLPGMSLLPEAMLRAFQWFPDSFYRIALFQFFLVCLVVMPSTLLMGATMPVVISLLRGEGASVSRTVGTAYFYNTLGAIFGSFAMGFILIPSLGSLLALKLFVASNMVMGVGFLLWIHGKRQEKTKKRWAYAPVLALLILIPLAGQSWPEWAMDVCVSIYGQELLAKKENPKMGGRLFHQEGVNATVSIRQAYDHISLHINGKTDASNGQDMATQLLLGLLPHLASSGKKEALVIGQGSGVTGRVLLESDGNRNVWIAEIESAVVEASRFFVNENSNLHNNANVRFVINDARNFLMDSKRKFGLITSEPSNPWLMGISNLFTEEFYRLARESLEEGGVFVQWFHLYGMELDNYKMVLKTLAKVFPHIQLWESGFGDMLFVCSQKPVVWDFSPLRVIEKEKPKLFRDLAKILFIREPEDLWAYFNGAFPSTALAFDNLPVNTDQRPLLEFTAPLALYSDTLPANKKFSRELFLNTGIQEEVGYPGLRIADCGLRISGEKSETQSSKSEICGIPGIVRTKALKRLSYQLTDDARTLLSGYPEDWRELDLPRAQLALIEGRPAEGVRWLEKYEVASKGKDVEERLTLAEAAAGSGKKHLAERCAKGLMEEREDLSDTHLERLAAFWETLGDLSTAYETASERAVPSPNYRLLFLMGKLQAKGKNYSLAERHFRDSLALNPHSGSTLILLGNALWIQGKKEEAKVFYREYQENWEGNDKVEERLKE